MTPYQRERSNTEGRYLLRKSLDAAENRMRNRTARQQLADAMEASRAPRDLPEPDDGDDASAQRHALR